MSNKWKTISKFFEKLLPTKLLSILFFVVTVAALVANIQAWHPVGQYTNEPFFGPSTILWFACAILGPLLSSRFGELFWISKPRNRVIDEREKALRRLVFEISYSVAVLIAFVLIFISYSAHPRFAYPGIAFLTIANLFYAIPSVVAAWMKKLV
jgi:uncharacterized Tic20 family protein